METRWKSEYATRHDLRQVEELEADNGKGIIIIPQRLLQKIDRNRDKLSRTDFVGLYAD